MRIAGIDIPDNKRGEIALTYIYGLGRSSAVKILNERGISGYQILLIGDGREKQSLMNTAKIQSLESHIVFMNSISKDKKYCRSYVKRGF